MTEMIGSGGLGQRGGVLQYPPSDLPKGKTVEQVRTNLGALMKGPTAMEMGAASRPC
jgi:hypothetical protein